MYQARFAARKSGYDKAPLTVYELSDFQCPYCRAFALEVFPALDSLYVRTGLVRWVFLHFPARRSHPNALRAAEFSMCAASADEFWPMHDLLFETQPEWEKLPNPDAHFESLADKLGLDRNETATCLADPNIRLDIEQDLVYPRRLRIGGVPSFIANGRLMTQGARPVSEFRAVIDSALAASARR